MKKIIQHKFKDYYFDASNHSFEYKKYDKYETQKNDKEVKAYNEFSDNSYVEINIKFNYKKSSDEISFLSPSTSSIENLLLKKYDAKDFTVFNKINSTSKNFMRYYHDKNIENYSYKLERIGVNSNNNNELIDIIERGHVLNINKKYEKDIQIFSKSYLSYEEDDFLTSEDLFSKEVFLENNDWFINEYNFSQNANFLFEFPSNSFDSQAKGSTFIGFLVEKFRDNELLSKDFIYYKLDDRQPVEIENINYAYRDPSVKYGKKYTYLLYPAFLAVTPKKNDYRISQGIVFCDAPYIVKIDCVESVNPEPPCAINFTFNRMQKSLNLNWTAPYEETGDVKGYIIFKRHDLKTPYTSIGVVGVHDEFDVINPDTLNINKVKKSNYPILEFTDDEFNVNKVNVYSIVAYDAHGNVSNYSEQISVLYNPVTKRISIDPVSVSGAPLDMPNLKIPRNVKYFGYNESIESVVPVLKEKSKISLYCTPEFVKLKNKESDDILLKDKYVFNIFKLENQQFFSDIIKIKNFSI